MKKLIWNLLGSKPTKRQANKFIRQQNEWLVIVTRHLELLDSFTLFNMIVYYDSLKHNSIMTDIYKGLEKTDGLPVLLDELGGFRKTPVIAPIVVENNKKKVVDRITGMELMLKKLHQQGLYPKLFLILNEGGLCVDGRHVPFVNIHDNVNCPSRDLALMKSILPPYGFGIIAGHQHADSVLKMIMTGNNTNSLNNDIHSTAIPPTLLRNIPLSKYTVLDKVDKHALQDVLEDSFGKAAKCGYIDSLADRLVDISVVDGSLHDGTEKVQYDGVTIITNEKGYTYLDKFAVRRHVQGEGVAEILWNVVQSHPQIVWRSKINNPANGWYANRCDGFLKRGQWVVFWRGTIPDLENMSQLVVGLPATF
jgi:hypothetical protein